MDHESTTQQGTVKNFQNTGTSNSPAFVEARENAFLFGYADFGYRNRRLLVDIDGNLDAIVGDSDGHLVIFRSLARPFADGFENGNTFAWSNTVPIP